MYEVVLRDAANRWSQLSQYVGEQAEVDVHVDRFVDVISPRPFEHQRDSGRIEMRLESRWAFECANIKFIGIFERYLSLVWDRFRHRASSSVSSKRGLAAVGPFLIFCKLGHFARSAVSRSLFDQSQSGVRPQRPSLTGKPVAVGPACPAERAPCWPLLTTPLAFAGSSRRAGRGRNRRSVFQVARRCAGQVALRGAGSCDASSSPRSAGRLAGSSPVATCNGR